MGIFIGSLLCMTLKKKKKRFLTSFSSVFGLGMDEERIYERVGAFLASESVPVLVSIPRPRTLTITNKRKVRAHDVLWPAIPIQVGSTRHLNKPSAREGPLLSKRVKLANPEWKQRAEPLREGVRSTTITLRSMRRLALMVRLDVEKSMRIPIQRRALRGELGS